MSFERKPIRLAAESYIGPKTYFLTVCTDRRRSMFSSARTVEVVLNCLMESLRDGGFSIPAYCFMPDHLHILVEGLHPDSDLLKSMKLFKQVSAYRYKRQTGGALWQSHYYDHIPRGDESWHAVAWYIWNNPVRKGLCRTAREWPFSGSLVFDWLLFVPPQETWCPPWKQSQGTEHA